ncbi:hypothetical protein [Aquibacillus rhizosphaerae]|uniref:ABC transporter permease n=1 Tax=Aquibacillus rhizosphaerae TaxID=3051431 RepID=A0ABT7LBJ7_9BACI|nr:hypothetical protein [Aquibacillus sp. LR5S19]MDL4842779.1 hypothetical protein [Aquibacillus sp. LR5S19]
MSLPEINTWRLVRKQHAFKLKSYAGMYTSLMAIQVIGMLFSLGGVSSGGVSGDEHSIEFRTYSSNVVIAFTFLWAFISSILITTRAYRNDDFTFVTNRLTSNLSNLLFLLSASVIAGITSIMTGNVNKVIAYFFYESDYIIATDITFQGLLMGTFVTILYIFAFAACGYLVGTIVQFHKLFIVVIPTLIIGSMFIGTNTHDTSLLLVWIMDTYGKETSILLFVLKMIGTVGLLFLLSITLSNRMEVKQ